MDVLAVRRRAVGDSFNDAMTHAVVTTEDGTNHICSRMIEDVKRYRYQWLLRANASHERPSCAGLL